jgi:hypothetical protein
MGLEPILLYHFWYLFFRHILLLFYIFRNVIYANVKWEKFFPFFFFSNLTANEHYRLLAYITVQPMKSYPSTVAIFYNQKMKKKSTFRRLALNTYNLRELCVWNRSIRRQHKRNKKKTWNPCQSQFNLRFGLMMRGSGSGSISRALSVLIYIYVCVYALVTSRFHHSISITLFEMCVVRCLAFFTQKKKWKRIIFAYRHFYLHIRLGAPFQ